MDRRMKLLTQRGVRSFDSYNKLAKADPLPRILIFNVCDWADVETFDSMALLSSTGPKAGIHLFVVANRLSDKNLSQDVKANIPTRAVFTVTSSQDSKLAGVKGAEELEIGEMLFREGNAVPQRLTAIFTPDANVRQVVEAVKRSATTA
jgi:S-DNA-T family DNA segregation ATPase FtsK/SpoIIIE